MALPVRRVALAAMRGPESQMAGKPRSPRLSGGQRMAVKWVRINETWYNRPALILGVSTPPGTGRGFASERSVSAILVHSG